MFKLLVASLFTLIIVMPAQGASDSSQVSSLMAQLKTNLTATTKLQGTLDDFTLANEQLMKENKVLADNRKLQQANLDKTTAVYQKQYDSEMAAKQGAIDAVLAEYNSLGCAGTLPEAQYNRCVKLHAQYTTRIDSMKASGNAYLQTKMAQYNKALEPLQSIVDRQTARIDEIYGEMTANLALYMEAQDQQKALNDEIAKIRVTLADLCSSNNTSVAARQLCNGVNWDGTRTDLPSLIVPVNPNPTVVVPNK